METFPTGKISPCVWARYSKVLGSSPKPNIILFEWSGLRWSLGLVEKNTVCCDSSLDPDRNLYVGYQCTLNLVYTGYIDCLEKFTLTD